MNYNIHVKGIISTPLTDKIFRRMKLTIVLTLLTLLQVSAASLAQRITIVAKNMPLSKVMKDVQKQSGYRYLLNRSEYQQALINVDISDADIQQTMSALLKDLPYEWTIKDNMIVIKPGIQKVKQQQVEVTGMVTDTTGRPIPGATVIVKNQSRIGTSTDNNGRYILEVPANGTLVFAYVGFLTTEEAVAGRSKINVQLKADDTGLEEVVVVGFGTQKKQSVVGAVESIKPSSLKTSSSSFTTAFAGKIAGMVSVQKSGEPGSDGANFWIRGISSFAGNINPLIILDGVEVNQYVLNSLPPEVIDQFSILKDATATALYGTRGANGVLIINTKTGSNRERMNINARVETGFSSHTKEQRMADGVTYMTLYNEAIKSRIGSGNYIPKFTDEKIDGTRLGLDPFVYPNVNWNDILFKPYTTNQNANINVSGGGSNTTYFINASVFNENGLFKNYNDRYSSNIVNRKYNLQSNVSANITPSTTLGIKVNAIFQDRDGPSVSTANVYSSTLTAPPTAAPVLFPSKNGEDHLLFGTAAGPYAQGYFPNPYADLVRGHRNLFASTTLGVIDLTQKLDFLLKGLEVKALASFNNYSTTSVDRTFKPHYFAINQLTDLNPDGTYNYTLMTMGEPGKTALATSTGSGGDRRTNLQASIGYTQTFAAKHEVNAMVLYHQKQYNNNQPGGTLLAVLPQRQQGLAGRLTYNYDQRYFTEFNFGYNGSENFKKGNRFGFFPSIAAGYVISNEPFFKDLNTPFDLLKLRGSYGLVGNDQINTRFPYITNVDLDKNFYYFGYDFNNGLGGPNVTLLGNEDAQWEIGEKLNLGLEIGLYKHFSLIADVFRERRSDIFMQRRTIPAHLGMGATLPFANIGKVQNQGVDLTLEYNKAIRPDFIISARGTFTYAANKLLDRDEPKQQEPYLSEIGQPLYMYKGLVAEGLFSSVEEIANSPVQTYEPVVLPGDIKYKDLNNDGKIDNNDMTYIGNPSIPQVIYGFGTSLQYKNFGFSISFQGTGKVSLMMSGIHPFDKNEFNVLQYIVDDYWSEANPNQNARYPRLDNEANNNNSQYSTYWLKDASFLRLKDVEFSYTFKKVRAYLSGNNLIQFSSFKAWDPELGSGSGLSYPLQKTFRIGLQFNFN